MALYRLEGKIISRGNRGRSVVASAAYRSGSMLHKAAYRSGNQLQDERARETFNYRARAQEVLHTEILAPKEGPSWLQSEPPQSKDDMRQQRPMRERLWNTIERIEKRKDSRLAREFVLALARELSLEQQIALVREWCKAEFVAKGLVVDFAIHKSKLGNNPHAHVLVTTRPVEGEGFGKKPSTAGEFNRRGAVGLKGKSELRAWRESWAEYENNALEAAGRPERVDHRSLKDRGVDRIPEPKMGPAATAMKRRGLEPERFKLVRFVKLLNEMRPWARALQKLNGVKHDATGRSWWDRSRLVMSHGAEIAKDTARETWRIWLDSRKVGHTLPGAAQKSPDRSR